MNKPAQKLTYILILAIFLFSSASTVLGTSEDNFNPNFLISDEEMQNSNAMNRADIQAFLNERGSFLTNLKIEDKNGEEKMASDIIYRSAQEHQINPKYLLVKLQKEQSLITDQSPSPKQLAGATGYGITDGCGWSCETYLNNQGFGKQVDSAAGIIRWYYENVDSKSWIKRPNVAYSIDNSNVTPANYATAFLYTYTPHLQGNQNFWILWQQWFSQVYPDGSLVKSVNDPNVYLIQNGQKRKIASMSVLMSRFDPKMILTIPESELNNYEHAKDLSLPNYSILRNGSQYYLIDFDEVRPFASYQVVQKLGFNPGEIIDVTANDLSGYKIGSTISVDNPSPTGRLVRLKETNGLYYLKDKQYHSLTDDQIANINFSNISIEKMAAGDLASYQRGQPILFKDGTLFGVRGFNKIYVVEKGKKRHISSEEVFNGLGFNWNNIIWTDDLTGSNHPDGEPLYLRLVSKSSTSNEAKSEESKSENLDAPVLETGKMIITPENKTTYVGNQFQTNVDSYLVATYPEGKILAGKNIDSVRPLASFTKVMSAYRLLKEGLSLSKTSTYNEKTQKSAYHQFRIVNGEKIRNSDLMSAMLISSINTATTILVNQVDQSEANFVKRMNQQIKDWGLTDTKFADSYGYDLGNVGTAKEFLTIFLTAGGNITVNEYLSKKSYEYDEILDKDGKPHHYDFHSNLLMNKNNLGFKVLTSKTGYLDEAGAGLVMIVEKPTDGKKFVIITMGNPDYVQRFDEPEKLTKWALSQF